MNTVNISLAQSDSELYEIAQLAEEIWHEHFTPIIGEAQVNYMVEKFQSYPALQTQIKQEGYGYYQLYSSHTFAGYIGIHPEDDALFLSKLYIKKDCRGQHLATAALNFLIELCKKRGLKKIWLTCNRHNNNRRAGRGYRKWFRDGRLYTNLYLNGHSPPAPLGACIVVCPWVYIVEQRP